MTTCIENISCMPTTPMEVFKLYDINFGAGSTIIIMALITGIIIMGIYVRTKSLALLAVLGIYAFAAFGTMILSPYIASQYQIMVYVVVLAATTVAVMMLMKLVKE